MTVHRAPNPFVWCVFSNLVWKRACEYSAGRSQQSGCCKRNSTFREAKTTFDSPPVCSPTGALFALTIWFLGGALYFAREIRRDLVDPSTRLRAISALQAGMGGARENLLNATLHGGPTGKEQLEAASAILSELG